MLDSRAILKKKKTAKGNYLNRKQTREQGAQQYQEERKSTVYKVWVNPQGFFSPRQFSKLYFTVAGNIITLSYVLLKHMKKNTYSNYKINQENKQLASTQNRLL